MREKNKKSTIWAKPNSMLICPTQIQPAALQYANNEYAHQKKEHQVLLGSKVKFVNIDSRCWYSRLLRIRAKVVC